MIYYLCQIFFMDEYQDCVCLISKLLNHYISILSMMNLKKLSSSPGANTFWTELLELSHWCIKHNIYYSLQSMNLNPEPLTF